MYEYFNGILTYKSLDYIVIDINGVGYKLKIPFKTYEQLPEINNRVKIYVYTSIRENDISYYGFNSKIEKEVFQTIISISNIGPKIGLAILSTYTVTELINIINESNLKKIEQVNGIGKSKSSILLASLKNKFDKLLDISFENSENIEEIKYLSIKEDIILALESLGYKNIKLDKYISDEELKELKDESVIMREVLKRLSK